MGDENPIRTLGDYSKRMLIPRTLVRGSKPTPQLEIGLNIFQQDPLPNVRILLLVSLLNSFHREGPQNSAMISRCSNNIMENLYLKHGLKGIDYAVGGRLRKLKPDEACAAIERLAQYEDEWWNDAFIPDE
ncbi:hypothetical protein Tco_0739262, partial [Tanacetum coccineum]